MQGKKNNTLIVTPAADDDLTDIWLYIADENKNEAAADNVIRRINKTFDSLRGMPMMGKARDELHPGIRSFPVGSHIIFYRIIETVIEIVRVLSARMDIGEDDF